MAAATRPRKPAPHQDGLFPAPPTSQELARKAAALDELHALYRAVRHAEHAHLHACAYRDRAAQEVTAARLRAARIANDVRSYELLWGEAR